MTLRPLGKREKKKLANSPVRRCTKSCFFFENGGSGCSFYAQRDVSIGEPCMFDLVKMRGYAEAFAAGDTKIIKDDAANITAMVMIQVQNMLQQVNVEGATVKEPMVDAKGAVVYIPDPDWDKNSGEERMMVPAMRIKEHPLISKSIQLAKSIGVNLAEFKLTPKSADEKAAVSGHTIIGEKIDMKVIMEQRIETEKRFIDAISAGNKMTQEDPVYQKLLQQGDIVDE